MLNVLLADDETRTLHHLMTGVPWFQLGMEVCCTASNGSEALAFIESHPIDILITDIRMPGMDGLEILRRLREGRDTADVPVIMLTARSSEFDKVTGLDSGADDYIAKPFGMMELISRIRAVLRRVGPETEEKSWRIGSLYVQPGRHIVQVGGVDVALTYKEYELLCALLEADGRVLTRDTLLSTIWGYDFDGDTRTVDVHIRRLRQKLGEAGSCIETVKGIGYKIGG